MLAKVKVQSRTVALVHREAEGSLIALQLLLALATQTESRHGKVVVLDSLESPRRILLRIRGGMTAKLRTLGPRQFARYLEMLERVRSENRLRTSPKVRQVWPRRKDHKAPKPPTIPPMNKPFKSNLTRILHSH